MNINIEKFLNKNLNNLIEIAAHAGYKIMNIYNSDFEYNSKEDGSPLTDADLASHACIYNGLNSLNPKIPILSEESELIKFDKRSKWEKYWLIDPLDGTKEFIKRNGEFTVNISLISNNKPIFGVIYAPCLDSMFFALKYNGCFQIDKSTDKRQLKIKSSNKKIKVIGSRSHQNEKIDSLLKKIGDYEYIGSGSSLKFCMIANNSADIYPRFSPTSEWDTAAGQAIVEESGGKVLDASGQTLSYNSKESIRNPNFIAVGNIDRRIIDSFYKILK